MEITFYYLTKTTLFKTLPTLVAKISDSGKHSFILCKDDEQVQDLNHLLWTNPSNAFIPHDIDGCKDPDLQPLLLTMDANTNLNNSTIGINLIQSRINENLKLDKYLYVFYGNSDEPEVLAFMNLYNAYRKKGYTTTLWQQDEKAKWIKS